MRKPNPHTPPHWSKEHRKKFLAWLNDELDKEDDREVTRQFLGSHASAIETAAAGETQSGSTEGESAAPEGRDAQ